MFDIDDKELLGIERGRGVREELFSALIMIGRFASDIVYGKPLKDHDVKHAYNLFTGIPLYTFNTYNRIFNSTNDYNRRVYLLKEFKKQVEKFIQRDGLYLKENYELDEYYEDLGLHTMNRINSTESITNSARSLSIQLTALAVVLAGKTRVLMEGTD